MTNFIRITGRDPLVARDGRPFGAGQGNRMRSVGWLYPSVVAGSFRTAIAKEVQKPFDNTTTTQLLQMDIAGVFPVAVDELYLPAPNDCVLKPDGTACRAHPEKPRNGEGGDWPADGLWPVMLSEAVAKDDFKPAECPAYWPLSQYADWLVGKTITPTEPNYLAAPLAETRDHVSIGAMAGVAEEGLLFTTIGVSLAALPKHGASLDDPVALEGPRRLDRFTQLELVARVENAPGWAQPTLQSLSIWHSLGGERRLAHWREANDAHVWDCPTDVLAALGNAKQVTMTLVTPAVFADGWKPGWLNEQLIGTPPSGGPTLKLVGVCIQRWRAVSGWSYVANGPKAVRRVVPAGGVYFFEVARGSAALLGRTGWLRSVSDPEQDRRDGFGLAIWGLW